MFVTLPLHAPWKKIEPCFGLLRQVRQKASHMTFAHPLYNWSLGGGAPESMIMTPADIWAGDSAHGRLLCGGAFACGDEPVMLHGDCWEPEGISGHSLFHMHAFEWLRDLRALGGEDARRQSRNMIASWIRRYPRWSAYAWQPELTGRRIANWIALYEFYGASVDAAFEAQLFDSLTRQARHLSRALPGETTGLGLLYAIKALVYAGLAFSGREAWLAQGLDLLQQETTRQVLPDGGHASRSPAQLLEALQIFIDIRAGLSAGGYPVPEQITHTIDRMAQALRFFRYPDKGFALFNGAQEGNAAIIDHVLFKSGAKGRVLNGLPQSGYERATLGRSVLMMDAGAPPPAPYDGDAHAAPLAFEFTYGKERVLVSCGSLHNDTAWRGALRGTAAHNTLGIDHRNACEIRDDETGIGGIGRRPRSVTTHREDSRDAVLIEGAHDGYVPVNGITHRRRLYLTHQGHSLRGEENLTCTIGLGKPADIAVRFHLHPKVQASLIQDGSEALLRLQGGSGWRFFHTGGALALEDSLYLGEGNRPRKTKQLVIYGRMETDIAQIKWAMQREGL